MQWSYKDVGWSAICIYQDISFKFKTNTKNQPKWWNTAEVLAASII